MRNFDQSKYHCKNSLCCIFIMFISSFLFYTLFCCFSSENISHFFFRDIYLFSFVFQVMFLSLLAFIFFLFLYLFFSFNFVLFASFHPLISLSFVFPTCVSSWHFFPFVLSFLFIITALFIVFLFLLFLFFLLSFLLSL